jgi:hypothetical protein
VTRETYLAEHHDGVSAEVSGVNLMPKAARFYTQGRLPIIEALEGAALRDRLYRNLLSSQPIAFNIAGELREEADAAAAVLRRLTNQPVAGLGALAAEESRGPANGYTAPI